MKSFEKSVLNVLSLGGEIFKNWTISSIVYVFTQIAVE